MRTAMWVALLALLGAWGCATRSDSADQIRAGIEAGRRGYWQEAAFRFERAKALEPANPEVLNNLAVAQEALGRYEDALATYKEALEKAPRNPHLRRNYARFAEFYTSYARGVKPKEVADAH